MQSVPLELQAPARLVRDLLAAQLPDGGWRAHPHVPADTESTAFASISLAAASNRLRAEAGAMVAAVDRGVAWLARRQQADGGWPLNDQVPGSTWTTAPAVLALALIGRNGEQVQRAANWIVARKGTGDPWVARLLRWIRRAEDPRQVTELDPTIPGWPWAGDTFSWVEPTAMAVLALRAALARGMVTDVDAANRRLGDAARWFLDRKSAGGGWNYGNRRVLGYAIEPYPDTTAWALLAMRAIASAEAAKDSLERLHALMRITQSPLARALAVLADRAYSEDPKAMTVLLASQCAGQSTDTTPADTRARALALLALAGPPLPLEVS